MTSASSMSSTRRKSLKRSVSKFLSKSFKKKKDKRVATSPPAGIPVSILDDVHEDVVSIVSPLADNGSRISCNELKDVRRDRVGVDDNPLLDHLLGMTESDSSATHNGEISNSYADVVTAEMKDGKDKRRDEATMTKDDDSASDLVMFSGRQQQQQDQQEEEEEEKKSNPITAVPEKLKNFTVSIMSPVEEEDGNIDEGEENNDDNHMSRAEEVKQRSLDEKVRSHSPSPVVGNGQTQPQQKAAPVNILSTHKDETLPFDDDKHTTGIVSVTVEMKKDRKAEKKNGKVEKKNDSKEVWSKTKRMIRDEINSESIVPWQEQHEVEEEEKPKATTAILAKLKNAVVPPVSPNEEEKESIDRKEENKRKGLKPKQPILHEKIHAPSNPTVVTNGGSRPQERVDVGATGRKFSIIPHSLTMHPMFRSAVICLMYLVTVLLLSSAKDSNWSIFRSQPTANVVSQYPSETKSIIHNLGDGDGTKSLVIDENIIPDLQNEEEAPIDGPDRSARSIKDLIDDEPDRSARVIEDLIGDQPDRPARVIEDVIDEIQTTIEEL